MRSMLAGPWARGVGAQSLAGKNATFATPVILAELIDWAEKVVTE